MSPTYLEDVIDETGISERNVKYWSQKYDLPVEKDGRRNVYPDRTVKLLRLVRLLSESELFNHRFIRVQIQRALGRAPDDIDHADEYESVRDQGKKLLESIEQEVTGSTILPTLEQSKAEPKKQRKKKRSRSSSELDEGIL